ncbi:hypothetical protein [Streptomyces zhihengii]
MVTFSPPPDEPVSALSFSPPPQAVAVRVIASTAAEAAVTLRSFMMMTSLELERSDGSGVGSRSQW